jgi:geranylgeranyl diphosphate synthase type II
MFPESVGETALEHAIRHAVLTPGKRIRPALTVLASWEFGVTDVRALDAGCALEMVHAASLVLDDLPCMDDAPLRRDAPATHIVFGQDVALLASITLLSRAFALVSSAAGLSGEQRARLVAVLAEAVGSEGLAGGQFRDLRGGDAPHCLGGISDANHRKTGALFIAAVEMAGIVADASPAQVGELREFATELGHAFQILDDLDDGDPGPGGRAEDDGKVNVLSFLGREGARNRLQRHLGQARSRLRPGGELAMFLGTIFGAKVQPSGFASPMRAAN